MNRRRAREIVLQLLYADDLNPKRKLAFDEPFIGRRLHFHRQLMEFARKLLQGVRQHRAEIDERLGKLAANWAVQRMAVIDRNLLRLATYEIIYGGTPPLAAINEAIELAKRYGARQSSQFVNGILDRVLATRQASPGPPSVPPPAPPTDVPVA